MVLNRRQGKKISILVHSESYLYTQIPSLVAIDQEAAIQMFVSHVEQLPIASIVDQLSHDRKSLHDYLHRVFVQRLGEYNIEIYAKFHELQVELYAEYDPDSLLPFIRTSNFVSLEKVCNSEFKVVLL